MINIRKINNKLISTFQNKVFAELNEKNRSIVVCGQLDKYDDVIKACKMCVVNKYGYHVVNKIVCNEVVEEKIHQPIFNDKTLDGKEVDVLIIGGGICGCAIARELTKNKLSILLVDKESDVAMGASSRNDGQIHPGVDQKTHNLKLKYELLGNKMYGDICKQLDVPFQRVGQLVAIKGLWLKPILTFYAAGKRKLGVWDTKIISKEELYKQIPNLNPGFDFAISNESTGIVCPYGLTIAYAENAVSNGAEISLNTIVKDINVENGKVISVSTNRGTIYPKVVVNAAGVYSDKIAQMAKDEFFSIHPRKGTDIILDKKVGNLTLPVVSNRSLKSIKEESKSHTKGGGILHTVDNNILLGPDAKETYLREDYSTSVESINNIINKQKASIDKLNKSDIITYFSGIRAANFEEDFIIEKGRETKNIVHCAAIQSPGLTAAPALALEIEKLVLSCLTNVEKNEKFNPTRKGIPVLRNMNEEERNAMIQQNPDYGKIICRCEEISKGEILDALKRNPSVETIDGIKKRVRPGMGRCQGGFCSPLVSQIIAEYKQKEIKDITKSGNDSYVSLGRTK